MIKSTLDAHQIATITLDRDDKRNALNEEMANHLIEALHQAEQAGARAVVIRANPGAKVFCAGHDLHELDPQKLLNDNATLRVVAKILASPLPVVAMVEGNVYAGGLIILLAADIVVAANNSQVAITSNKLGIPLAPHLHAFWLRVMGIHKTKELLFTAAPISAQDAYSAGLFNHVVETDELANTTAQITSQILQCDPAAIANTKFQINLLAQQTALSPSDHAGVSARNSQLASSPETTRRILALLESLHDE